LLRKVGICKLSASLCFSKDMNKVKSYLLIVLLISLVGELHATSQVNPTGGEVINHGPWHTGVDLDSSPGEKLTFPIASEVMRIETDLVSSWRGIILRGTGDYSGYKFRLLGLQPFVEPGATIGKNTIIGEVQDPRHEFPDLNPYIHFEVYENDTLIDPTPLASEFFPDRKIVNPGAKSSFMFPHYKLLNEAAAWRGDGEIELEIIAYEKALKLPDWETIPIFALHHLADSYASIGDFENAVRVQEKLVRVLRLQLEFAAGKVPSAELGVIAAVNREQSLNILINAQTMNLDAYKANEQTAIHY